MNRKSRRNLIRSISTEYFTSPEGLASLRKSMEYAERVVDSGPWITAASPTGPDGTINATWEAEFSIVAEAPAADLNPSAKLDNADAADPNKKEVPAGTQSANNGTQKPGKDGKPPPPKFTMSAYNGGPMKLNGWKFPVVIDGQGMKYAPNVTATVYHVPDDATASEKMEQLIGPITSCNVSGGCLTTVGVVTGESETVKLAQKHASNGFKWQASVDAIPQRIEFVRDGETQQVNGRPVHGPCVIARDTTLTNVALVPLGADTTTSAQLAANAAKGSGNMELAAWIKATYGIDPTTLTEQQTAKFKAEFDKAAKIAAGDKGSSDNPKIQGGDGNTTPIVLTTVATPQSTEAFIAAQNKAAADNLDRMGKIAASAKDHPTIAAQAVRENWTVDKTELEVLRAERKAMEGSGGGNTAPGVMSARTDMPKDGLGLQAIPAARGGREIAAGAKISNELSAVIETCGLISAGYSADRLAKNPAYGQRCVEIADRTMSKFGRGLGPVGLMRLAASFAGMNLPHDNWSAYTSIIAEFSTLSLPVILSNLMNKFLLDSYMAVDPDYCDDPDQKTIAWQKFTKRGPLQDFKPHYRTRLTSDLEFQNLGPSGEIQSGKVSEQTYMLQALTKAILFALSRVDITNDDLSAMSTLPTHFGRGAGISVAKLIYSLLILAKQSDRTTDFFTSSAVTTAGNLMQPNLLTTAALTFLTLEAAEAAFAVQTDPYGKPFGGRPECLLVPPAIKGIAMQLYTSERLIPSLYGAGAAGNARGTPDGNTLANKYKPVCSAWLSALTAADVSKATGVTTANLGSASTWYLAGGPQQPAYPIEAGFLNGQEMPIVERDEMQFDRLGIAFRGFIDFGANLAEPRSIVKSTA